ncbi:bifunctional glutamate N-acetyltransferase/amino-acid acetyltransferase ArgJ [Billgrantia desiderata]|uniref:bifunctional glutamate N-acetyltransferase/amino-acid acetyltransferase ArgJ n=1 Tax=Billgrantia desiderata TaxID=52021 RepID=UPI00089E8129|nr:bifunctional glutamate N-acetyltransferase/amino-acid acetyltransferase ArgJ [Halomonas desiderata]MCE8012203.1 bifunctional glutamate N-acetyltransferase/amino-acid acetyltransferase ArgJ [Halomonas desiderata]MCE8027923.1 bifunctional glutamate N-acetyltransferase/amino-acid acetyltransferase ArgJ [Halomonas desiderata]NIC37332.1 bifunctional glutamate N-acetyltransferase/amino-acid acetyltransferase ArgJ [Halomonas desiderata]SEG03164.1 glutamate N-acetyltransferase [Halomonas desiderata]
MAVGETRFPAMPVIEGLRLGSAMAGIKKPGRRDLVVIEIPAGARVAGSFTLNAFCAAPVTVAKQHLAECHGRGEGARLLVINTGNANAGTGETGLRDARATCAELARLAGVPADSVLPFSTGVIGEPLPMERLLAGLPQALETLSGDSAAWQQAGEGILTTDTRPKGASVTLEMGEHTVTINGISKGSGMIKPNMATMLAFVATDANIEQALLDALLRETVDRSFNCISVDGDTSTNDACMLIATGRGATVASDEQVAIFRNGLQRVMTELAQAIVRDGEGATKFVTLQVQEAATREEALDVAFTVAHSPLVKTALFASDANWGRILAAVGRAPLHDFDVGRVTIDLGDVRLVEQGGRAASYTEEDGSRVMREEEIVIRIALGRGEEGATVWTTDLSHDYVSINADYRS